MMQLCLGFLNVMFLVFVNIMVILDGRLLLQ